MIVVGLERSESCRADCCLLQGATLALGTIANDTISTVYNVLCDLWKEPNIYLCFIK